MFNDTPIECSKCGSDKTYLCCTNCDTAWISVKDGLPEHNQFILASDEAGNMMVVRCDIHRNGNKVIDYVFMMTDLTRQVIGISHWMPLPEPP